MLLNKTLKIIDTNFTEPLLVLPKVAIYKFDSVWSDTFLDGPLIIYKCQKKYKGIVLTKARFDFKFVLDKKLRLYDQHNLLVLMNKTVFGVYVSDRTEFDRLSYLVSCINEEI